MNILVVFLQHIFFDYLVVYLHAHVNFVDQILYVNTLQSQMCLAYHAELRIIGFICVDNIFIAVSHFDKLHFGFHYLNHIILFHIIYLKVSEYNAELVIHVIRVEFNNAQIHSEFDITAIKVFENDDIGRRVGRWCNYKAKSRMICLRPISFSFDLFDLVHEGHFTLFDCELFAG